MPWHIEAALKQRTAIKQLAVLSGHALVRYRAQVQWLQWVTVVMNFELTQL